jgi:hypothetical protein
MKPTPRIVPGVAEEKPRRTIGGEVLDRRGHASTTQMNFMRNRFDQNLAASKRRLIHSKAFT